MSTILATYRNQADAHTAIEALTLAGVASAEIGVATLDPNASAAETVTTASTPAGSTAGHAASDAASGAVAGGLLGTVGGLLVGVAALTIPGLGFLLAAGPLAAALGLTGVAATAATGAGIGVAAGGLTSMVASLVKAGVPENDATIVHDSLRSGGVVVSVRDQVGVDIRNALEKGNPVNITSMA